MPRPEPPRVTLPHGRSLPAGTRLPAVQVHKPSDRRDALGRLLVQVAGAFAARHVRGVVRTVSGPCPPMPSRAPRGSAGVLPMRLGSTGLAKPRQAALPAGAHLLAGGPTAPDLIMRRGQYLYTLSGHQVVTVRRGPDATLRVTARTSIRSRWRPLRLLLHHNRLLVFSQKAGRARVDILDVSRPRRPRPLGGWELEGRLLGERLRQGDLVLLLQSRLRVPERRLLGRLPRDRAIRIVKVPCCGPTRGAFESAQRALSKMARGWLRGVRAATLLPRMWRLRRGRRARARPLVRPEELLYPVGAGASARVTVLLRLDLDHGRRAALGLLAADPMQSGAHTGPFLPAGPLQTVAATAPPQAAGPLRMFSARRIFLAFTRLHLPTPHCGGAPRPFGWNRRPLSARTRIFSFQLAPWPAGIRFEAAAALSGRLVRVFSLADPQGTVGAFTVSFQGRPSGLYVLRAARGRRYQVVGALVGLAAWAKHFVVRTQAGGVVLLTRSSPTHLQPMSPLFLIDLSRPASPKVCGALRLPGDTNQLVALPGARLLTLGQGADARGRLLAPRIQIFDLRNPRQPRLLAQRRLPLRTPHSAAHLDVAASLFDPTSSLLVLPLRSGAMANASVLRLSGGSLTYLGEVDHAPLAPRAACAHTPRSACTLHAPILRSFGAGGALYTLSARGLRAHTISPFAPRSLLRFPSPSSR